VTQGVTRLYPLNIFGLEPVKQLGRERLLAAPVSCIETLDDGSILLIPHASGAMRPEDRSYTDPEVVAAYLGLVYDEHKDVNDQGE